MLTQLTTLKARLKIDSFELSEDTLLTNLIKECSGRFDRECNRLFERSAGATYEFEADKTTVSPPRFPIESVSKWEVKTDETEGWIEQTNVRYIFRRANETRVLILLPVALGTSDQVARVTYDGGFVAPGTAAGAGQTALPDAVEQVCIEQCVYWYQSKDRLGLTSIQGEGGTIQNYSGLDLLPHVRATLRTFQRFLP